MGLTRCQIKIRQGADTAQGFLWVCVEAWMVTRHFAVHRPVFGDPLQPTMGLGWVVTHVPTGMRFAATDSRDLAVRMARRLAAVRGIAWHCPDPQILLQASPGARNAARAAVGLPPPMKFPAAGREKGPRS